MTNATRFSVASPPYSILVFCLNIQQQVSLPTKGFVGHPIIGHFTNLTSYDWHSGNLPPYSGTHQHHTTQYTPTKQVHLLWITLLQSKRNVHLHSSIAIPRVWMGEEGAWGVRVKNMSVSGYELGVSVRSESKECVRSMRSECEEWVRSERSVRRGCEDCEWGLVHIRDEGEEHEKWVWGAGVQSDFKEFDLLWCRHAGAHVG